MELNQVILEGNLTKDPETKQTASGLMVTTFSLAVNFSKKSGDDWIKEVSFFDITTFGETANKAADLRKGNGIKVLGKLKQDRWQNQEGQNRSKVSVIAEMFSVRRQKQQTDDIPF